MLSHRGIFSLLLLFLLLLRTPPKRQAHISASKPLSQPRGPNPSLEAQIPRGRNLGLKNSWDLDLKTGIWDSMLRYGPGGWGGTEKKEKEKEEKKIPLCESIGHRSLCGRCPKRRTGRSSIIWTAVPVAPLMLSIFVMLRQWGSGPRGADDL